MTTLLLDIGNSRLKWGLLNNDRIGATGHVSLQNIEQRGVAALASLLPPRFDTVLACNVAGAGIGTLLSELGDVRFAKPTTKACGVTNGYRNPEHLGVDRWAAMIGARAATSSACLVVDAGTAITLDALDPRGVHLGGQIMPGLRLMSESLGCSTSDLPLVNTNTLVIDPDASPFATSTNDAIAKGILGAVAGSIERSLQFLRAAKADVDVDVILTGGDAAIIQHHLHQATELRPHLVLEGLACLASVSEQRSA